MTSPLDLGGNDLVVNTIYVGATAPGQSGTLLNVTDLTGITAGTAAANKALVLGASKEIATITTATITNLTSTTVTPTTIAGGPSFSAGYALPTTAVITTNVGAHTCSSNAATTTSKISLITTESLSTAHTASQAIVITLTGTTSSMYAKAMIVGGTNTQGVPILKTACTTDTVTITIQNAAIATNAFNGTFIIWLEVVS